MKKIIRQNVFETNSSSEHSLSISWTNEHEIKSLIEQIENGISCAPDKDDLYNVLGKIEKLKAIIIKIIDGEDDD